MELLFQEAFVDQSSLTVNHNLDRIDVAVRIIQTGGIVDDAVISTAIFNPADPRNSIVITMTGQVSGRVQVLDTGNTVVYPSTVTPSITARLKDGEVVYGSGAALVPFDEVDPNYSSEYFGLSNGMIVCKKHGIYEVSFKVNSKFQKGNRTKQHSKCKIGKFNDSQTFVEYIEGTAASGFHRNGTDGSESMVCPPFDVEVEKDFHLGAVVWRHSGKEKLVTVPDGSFVSVRLMREK